MSTPVPPEGFATEAPTESLGVDGEDVGAPAGDGGAGPRTLGRFVLLDLVGEGGMGRLLKAYDPQLDRVVALKLLRARGARWSRDATARERLLREAKALARLSHPNVVPVFDAGSLDDQVFIAMEFVEGRTLRQWLRDAKRSAREVITVFTAAGEGLAAAHRAGLVHRDFKPDNVLVGSDGRVRVVDFGLARAEGSLERPVASAASLASPAVSRPALPTSSRSAPAASAPSALLDSDGASLPSTGDGAGPSGASPAALDAPLTEAGALLGTPRYMAPEQHLGEAGTDKTDQFAFGVSLFEALTGRPPFAAQTREELVRQVLRGDLTAVREARLPRWIRRVLLRSMARAPAQRYGSMGELLAALARDPARVRRTWAARLAIPLVAAGSLALGTQIRKQRSEICQGADARIAPAWSATRADTVERAFDATHLPYAARVFQSVRSSLDAYARAWSDAHREACLATRVRKEQGEELMELRMACLDQRRRELSGLVEVLEAADSAAVDRAASAAAALPPISSCEDGRALRSGANAAPVDPAQRRAWEAAREELGHASALFGAGRLKAAREAAERARDHARAQPTGAVLAESLIHLAVADEELGSFKEAEASLREAADLAAGSKDATLLADAWSRIMSVVGWRQKRHAEAAALVGPARSLLALAPDDPRLSARFHGYVARLHHERGHYDEARQEFEQELRLVERAYGPGSLAVAKATTNVATNLVYQGRYSEALPLMERTLALYQRELGEEHPDFARALNNLAFLHQHSGHNAEAVPIFRRVLSLRERLLGPDHPSTLLSTYNLASALVGDEKYDEAEALLQTHRARSEKRFGPEHPEVAWSLLELGVVAMAQRRYADAKAPLERALAIREKALGDKHPDVGRVLQSMAVLHCRLGESTKAAALLARGDAIREQSLGGNHRELAEGWLPYIECCLDQAPKRAALREEARRLAERALGVFETLGKDGEGKARATAEFLLARALDVDPRERARARALAQSAAARLTQGEGSERRAAEIRAWLAARARE